jgi:dUTP pyrophosphatase
MAVTGDQSVTTADRVQIALKRLPASVGLALPEYQTAGAAGMDLVAAVDTNVTLQPGEIARIPTGLTIAIPPGWEAQIRPRSGIAVKHGITLPNAPATIDSDYRGEIQVPLINLGRIAFTVERGMRMAQMIFARVGAATLIEVDQLPSSERGESGFGHTGI